jgi:alpha-L-fucosidase
MPNITPSARQLEFHSWERGLFLHFGIRTFYEGHRDWDKKPMPAEGFAPTDLDCDQWACAAKEAGFNYLVMTAKHHDGFANWPSKFSRYTLAQSDWRGGKGDLVREYVEACRRYGMKVGIYYSPADWHEPSFGTNAKAFDGYFLGQLTEILSNYGPIDILWFDGCGSENHTYDWPRIVEKIRELQPDVLMFNEGDPAIRWIGNEDGYAPLGTRNVVDAKKISVLDGGETKVARQWLVPECDFRMRDRNWFYSDSDGDTVKSLEELVGIWYGSCGRGANMLMNIGPDRRGLLPDADAARLAELGSELDRRFGSPVGTFAECEREGDAWNWKAPDLWALVDHVDVGEDVAKGESIRRFRIVTSSWNTGRAVTMYEGTAVGYREVCRFPAVRTRGMRLEVLESDGPVDLARLDFHCVGG